MRFQQHGNFQLLRSRMMSMTTTAVKMKQQSCFSCRQSRISLPVLLVHQHHFRFFSSSSSFSIFNNASNHTSHQQQQRRYLSTSLSSSPPAPAAHHHHVCVIGTGPAGFYVAQHILKLRTSSTTPVHVDLFEKLPVPFGLVRYGVAPDHPEVKNVTNTFNAVLRNDRVRFVGNVEAGTHFSFQQLADHYHAIVLCHGVTSDRLLGIPNETSLITSAREFVGWYNGLPSNSDLPVDLPACKRALVIGHGNVALDIARILLTPAAALEKTDIAPYALEQLRVSGVREVVIVGRRGLLHVAFTIKEFREMLRLPGVSWDVDLGGQELRSTEDLARPRKRLTDLIVKSAGEGKVVPPDTTTPSSRHWSLRFLRSPVSVSRRPEDNRIAVKFRVNRLDGDRAVPTDAEEEIVCDAAFRSIGYIGKQLFPELPFDDATGVIPNENGRVRPGVYCSGWAGQGPRGVILSTMQHSFDVARLVSSDLELEEVGGAKKTGFGGLSDATAAFSGTRVTGYADYLKIAEWEAKHGKKITDVREMMAVCDGGGGGGAGRS